MAISAAEAQTRFCLDFAGATIDVAQHPGPGVAKVGSRMTSYVLDRVLFPEEAVAFRPGEREQHELVSVTAAAHKLANLYGIPRGRLQGAVAFAFNGLVLGGLVTAGAEFDKGVDGLALPEIGVPTEDDIARYEALMRNPAKLHEFGTALGDFVAVITNPMSPARGSLGDYHAEIARVSRAFADDPGNPARFEQLGMAREALSDELRPILLNALPRHIGAVAGDTLVENVLRHQPSQALLAAHFPQQ